MSRKVVLISLLALCCVSATAQDVDSNIITLGDEYVINSVIDHLLQYARLVIREKKLDRVEVPVISEGFVGPFGMEGTFFAANGSAGYLSTVHRTGNATLIHGVTTSTLNLHLGLQDFVVDYNFYKAKFLNVGPTGKMRVTVGDNSVFISTSFTYNFKNCNESLDALIMDHFGDINVRLTGLDPLNWLLDDIATWVARDLRDNVKYLMEENLKEGITSAMKAYNICKYLPHFHTRSKDRL